MPTKKIILISFIAIILSSFINLLFAESLIQAPVNPEFLKYQENLKILKVQGKTEEHSFGYIPSPLDLSYLKGQKIVPVKVKEYPLVGYSSSYDLRQQNKVTSVKDQGSYGTCWAHATFASLESYLMSGENWDFSENNLANLHGFDFGFNNGGNYYMSTAYLVRWSGPIKESDDPYPNPNNSPTNLSPQKHVQEVLFLPGRSSPTDNDNIKWALTTYGAVGTYMYYDSTYYNSTNKTYYYNGSNGANHAVAIVGWDDNYDKNKFSSTPPGNGAFIVKNSWGTGWGDSGYFYVSYYDSNIGSGNAVFNNAEPATNYNLIYQYDPLGNTSGLGYRSDTAWFANIFTATRDSLLKAVGFYTASLNSSYEIYIYQNATSGPISGMLSGSKMGAIAIPGYHTITLDSAISVPSGQKFSVVVKLTTPGYNWPIPIEYPISNYSSGATASSGQSYGSSDGSYWLDLTDIYSNTNVCIKAYANIVNNNAPTLNWTGETNYTSDGLDPETGTSTTTFTYRVKYTDPNNDAPKSGYPKLHIKKGGAEISGSPFTMNEVDTNDKTYTDGKLYTYSKTLPAGNDYTYYFECYDVWNAAATGVPVNSLDAPDVTNNAPTLSWTGETNYTSDGLDPEIGDRNTTFTYRVKYTDTDNDEPKSGYPKVHIKKGGTEIAGSPFTMSYVTGVSSTGAIYTYSTSLSTGTDYTYYFEAYDVNSATASGSPTSSIDAPDVLTLGDAVDNTSLSWSTGGNANWFFQSSVYYYGGDAAQSGDIADSQSSYIQTTVTGPGTLKFYWKVSSEANCDYLRFYIDTTEQDKISGTVDWAQKSYSIPSGDHTFKWSYTKDSSIRSGSDCGWLDKVEWSGNTAPDLSWTGETNYTSDGLDPETGTSTTTFVYRVKYTDPDNDAPKSGYPKLHIKKGGAEISGSPFTMNEVDTNDKTYTDGKLYTYSKTLPAGNDYTYYFECYDVWNAAATGVPVNSLDAPDVTNNAPTLSWTGETNYTSDGLDPETGTSITTFVYRVKYTDSDNDAPKSGYPKLHIKKGGVEISGSPFTMNEVNTNDKTYTDGKLYTYSKTLPAGNDYTYYFEAQDSYGATAPGMPTSSIDSPDVFAALISGKVTKSDGTTPIFGAIVEAMQSGIVLSSATIDSFGNYSISVIAGTYDVRVSSSGYQTLTKTGISVAYGQKTIVNFALLGINEEKKQKEYKTTLGDNLFSPKIGGTAKIKFNVPATGSVSLKIYDLSGKLIRTLFEGSIAAGDIQKDWDGRDDSGHYVVPGVYFLHYVYPGGKEIRKIGVKK